MAFQSEGLERGERGLGVVELQVRLAGFRGTTWDGAFGGGTMLQVESFQRDFMGLEAPTGVVDAATVEAINRFAEEHPIDFQQLRCQCQQCGGFGQNRFENVYREGKPKVEAYHHREYPGIHKAILHSYRALCFYAAKREFPEPFITCGYRCWIHNDTKGRTSTNHMGKAIDVDFKMSAGEDKRDDCRRCDSARGALVETGGFQIGWNAANRKALEPSNIAPSWIHMDVRCYARSYLADAFFVTSLQDLDR